MIIIVILFFPIILFLEAVPLYRKKQWKDLCTYSVILGLALILAVLLSLGVRVPSPAKPIENLIDSVIDIR